MAFPRQAFPTSSKLKRRPTYTPYGVGLRVASTSSELRAHRALCPDTGPFRCPPYAKSPFAPSGCYPSRSATLRHLARSYPHIIAPTGSCARPKPSHFLRLCLVSGSLQVAASPCWELALPDIISAILAQVLGPLPRSVPLVHLLASSHETTASHPTSYVRHTGNTPIMQLQHGSHSRGCSHSLMFRLPRSLAPPGCTYR